MDMFAYQKDFQGKSSGQFTQRTLYQQLAITGLLSLSAFVFQNQALAAEYGSLSGGNITLNNGDQVVANQLTSGTLYAINNPYNNNNAVIDLASGSSVTSDAASTGSAQGIILQGTSSALKADGLNLTVNGNVARGLVISSKSTADLGNGGVINVTGVNSGQAIMVSGASTLKANAIEINTSYATTNSIYAAIDIQNYGSSVDLGINSSITTNARGATGVYVFGSNGTVSDGPAKFSASNLFVTTNGNMSYGINANDNSQVELGSGSTIVTHGANSTGIIMYSATMNADALTITTTGSDAIALEARTQAKANIGAGSHLSSAQAGALVASGSSVVVNFLGSESNRNSIFAGGSYGASAQAAGSVINLTNTDITIDRNGSLGLGLWAMGGGNINGENLTVNGAVGSRGVYAMTNSKVDLTGHTVINMADPSAMAIATQDNAGYAASRINATGLMEIQGGILSRGGMINIDMSSGSSLTGATSTDGVNGGVLNMTMAGTRWNMIADSSVTKLVLNDSTVDFAEDKTGSVLTVGDLSGSGTFIMRTDIVGDGDGVNNSGDRLVVTGTSAGNHFLKILNRGSLATTGNEVLTVVETTDGQASFGLDSSTPQVELGGYLYDVRKNGTNWDLYSSGVYVPPAEPLSPVDPTDPQVPVDPVAPVDPGTDGGNGGGKITTTADAGANFLNIGYLMNYAETQTLLQRMGDLRHNGESGDVWLRGFSGKFDSFASGKMSGFDMSYNGVQLGADKRIAEQMPLLVGGFIGMTDGDPNYRSGDGSVKSSHMGIYATYMASNGFYTDAVAKYSRLKNKFNVQDSQSNNVSGNGSSNGISFSLEAGKKFSLNRAGNGFYIEPQAQLSFSHQNSTDITASNGLKVDLGSYNSTLGRTSAIVGYEISGENTAVNVYLKTGYVREFDGDVDYKLNGSTEQHSFKGSWWNNGVGVSAQINKQHTLYMDIDSSTGNRFDQRQINGGYRFSF